MRELRKVEEQMKQVKGGVTAAKGFEAASTAAGIKYKDRYGNTETDGTF